MTKRRLAIGGAGGTTNDARDEGEIQDLFDRLDNTSIAMLLTFPMTSVASCKAARRTRESFMVTAMWMENVRRSQARELVRGRRAADLRLPDKLDLRRLEGAADEGVGHG